MVMELSLTETTTLWEKLFVSNVFFILRNMLRDQFCKCDIYQQFECGRWKYFIEFLRKNVFAIQLFAWLYCNRFAIWVIERDEHFHLNQVFICPCFYGILILAKRMGIKCDVGMVNLIEKKFVKNFSSSRVEKKCLFCVSTTYCYSDLMSGNGYRVLSI